MYMGFLEILILLILVLLGLAVWFARRGSGDARAFWVRSPRRRPPIVRAVCGLLGFGVLGAVAVGTGLDARSTYAEPPDDPIGDIRLPAAPPPAGPPESGRYLLHFVVMEATPTERKPIWVVEHEVRLPDDLGRTLHPDLDVPGHPAKLSYALLGVRADEAGSLRPRGSYTLEVRRHMGSYSASGTSSEAQIGRLGQADRDKKALSLSPGEPRTYALFCFATRVAGDDPLRAATADELVRLHEAEIEAAALAPSLVEGRSAETGALGLHFLAHVGGTGLLLLIAAILLSQTARRKSLAFAGWLAAIVVLAGAMDRAALGVHAARLHDPQAPLRDRQRACVRMADTFFFRKTAARSVEKVLQDPGLRDTARTVLPILD